MTGMLEPFAYSYMVNAMWVSALVGAVCAFLSAYLMLKGWSLIGDALSHSVVPGVSLAFIVGLPYAVGAFVSGGLAALAMLFIQSRTHLKQDAVIGLIFTGFFGIGLFINSLSPTPIVANASAETLWIAGEEAAPAKRFPDSTEASASVDVGESGEVLFREGGWVRLRLGSRFLWVEESRTTKEAPAGQPSLGGPGGIDISKLLEMTDAAGSK